MSTAAVTEALAVPLQGPVDYLYAGPLPDSGRTGRVTCGYGTAGGGDPRVEISYIDYVDAATAAERVDLTVQAALGDGSRVSEQPVGDLSGFVLESPDTASLVAAVDSRTLVVTLQRGVVPNPAVRSALDGIGTAVLAAQAAPPPG